MSFKLSENCIPVIVKGQPFDEPIVQVLSHKKVSSNTTMDRYRLILSDGVFYYPYTMLATQLNDVITSGQLPDNTIIKIDQYIPSNVNNATATVKTVIVILNLTILANGDEVGKRIGEPKKYEEGEGQNAVASTNQSNSVSSSVNSVPQPTNNFQVNHQPNISTDAPGNVVPVVSLNPYQNRWTIKVRVTAKPPIRTWSNARGEGKLFSMDLMDESGSIRATAFNEQCDKFFDMMELNKVYYITRGSIKPANKKFTSIPHDFELSLNRDTEVIPCSDASNIPQIQYNFTTFTALKDLAVDSLIDVVGICQGASDIQNLTARMSRRELKKRDIILVDQTNTSVTVSLWGTEAEQFDGSAMPVVAIKGGRLTEFQGAKTVSLGNSSMLQINPDIPEAHRLRGWFDSLNGPQQFTSISTRMSGDGPGNKILLLKEAALQQLGTRDKADYFTCEATIMFIPSDRVTYQACPNRDCNKKVVDLGNSNYRCEKCNQEFDNFKYRLILKPQIGDWTGAQRVSMFQEQSEQLLGATADDVGTSKHTSPGTYDSFFRKPLFKQYQFRIAARMDTFNNETRLNMSAISLKPVDFKESCKFLINDIERLAGMSIKKA